MIHELLSYERRSYLLYLSSQIQSTGPAIQTVKSIFDGQMSREETKSHLSSEKGGVPEGRMQRITPSDQRLYEYQFIGILCIYIYHMLWLVSMTPLSHCILKQLLVNHIIAKTNNIYYKYWGRFLGSVFCNPANCGENAQLQLQSIGTKSQSIGTKL